jgi:iron complex transport system ATP-binding protein
MLAVADMHVAYRGRTAVSGFGPPPFQPGSFTALIGPNAAGKSSALRAIAGIVAARGSVRLSDVALHRLGIAQRAQRVRYVPQAFHTSALLNVFEAVLVALRQGHGAGAGAPARVSRVLGQLDIADLADRPVASLSGGQQQLVALAQGLVVDAPVLLLDEPTSALDLNRQLRVMRLLCEVASERRMIILAAMHDLALAARHAARIVLLDRGRVTADGTADEVLGSAACATAYGVRLAVERNSRGSLTVEAHL